MTVEKQTVDFFWWISNTNSMPIFSKKKKKYFSTSMYSLQSVTDLVCCFAFHDTVCYVASSYESTWLTKKKLFYKRSVWAPKCQMSLLVLKLKDVWALLLVQCLHSGQMLLCKLFGHLQVLTLVGQFVTSYRFYIKSLVMFQLESISVSCMLYLYVYVCGYLCTQCQCILASYGIVYQCCK